MAALCDARRWFEQLHKCLLPEQRVVHDSAAFEMARKPSALELKPRPRRLVEDISEARVSFFMRE